MIFDDFEQRKQYNTMGLTLHANLLSQPSRAVAWLLKIKGASFTLVEEDILNGATHTPEYLQMNPLGKVPFIKDDDFGLGESHAILAYLCDKNGWEDYYPKDLKARALVDQYLHWHHSNTRHSTSQVLIPFLGLVGGNPSASDKEMVKKHKQTIQSFVEGIDSFLKKPFIAETDTPTIADLSAYCEIDQICDMGVFDFSKYPKVAAWIEKMKALDHHDEVHTVLDQVLTDSNLKPVPAELLKKAE